MEIDKKHNRIKCHGENRASYKGIRIAGRGGWKRSCSTKAVNVGLTEKVTLEQRLERGKGVSPAAIGEEHSRKR